MSNSTRRGLTQAAAAAVLVAGLLSGCGSGRAGSSQPSAATGGAAPTAVRTGRPQGVPSTPVLTTRSAAPVVATDLHEVHIIDATFTGTQDGWLLARADCINKPGICTAMLRTTDGGAHWTTMPSPSVNVPGVKDCQSPCVDHIRFPTARIGYAYGAGFDSEGKFSGALFMTTDAGKSWQQQKGSAVALETLDGIVIRVSTTHPDCGGFGCDYLVETSTIGSTTWQDRPIGRYFSTSVGAILTGGGRDVYLLVLPHLSGNAPASLYRSSDDGKAWTNSGGGKTHAQQSANAPCPQSGGETVGSAIAAGTGGRVSMICTPLDTGRSFLAVSTDHGAHFTAEPGTIPHGMDDVLAGDPHTVLIAAGSADKDGTGVYRSTNGGESWQPVPGISGGVSWLGFQSTKLGRIVSGNGDTIWTTHDAGGHWTPRHLG